MRDLGSVIPVAVRGVLVSGGFGTCAFDYGSWGRYCLGSVLVGVGALVYVVRYVDGAGAEVLVKMICTLGSSAGGW